MPAKLMRRDDAGDLLGETAKLDKVWTEEYRSTGTFHALVISGAHIAVLAAFLRFVLRILFVPRGFRPTF